MVSAVKSFDSFKIGDLIEVVRNDDKSFKCIVVENYQGAAFVCRVLKKDEGVGTSSWSRYDLDETSRVQVMSECKSIKRLAESVMSKATSSLSLNESIVRKDEMTYYTTDLGNGEMVTLCLCEGHGGWSFDKDESSALKESYLNSQIIKYNKESVL